MCVCVDVCVCVCVGVFLCLFVCWSLGPQSLEVRVGLGAFYSSVWVPITCSEIAKGLNEGIYLNFLKGLLHNLRCIP